MSSSVSVPFKRRACTRTRWRCCAIISSSSRSSSAINTGIPLGTASGEAPRLAPLASPFLADVTFVLVALRFDLQRGVRDLEALGEDALDLVDQKIALGVILLPHHDMRRQ